MTITYVKKINPENLDAFINSNGLNILDIYADWCRPCKNIAPIVDEVSIDYQNKLQIGKFDADSDKEKIMSMGIRNIPTLIFYKDGVELERKSGVFTKKELVDILNKYITNE